MRPLFPLRLAAPLLVQASALAQTPALLSNADVFGRLAAECVAEARPAAVGVPDTLAVFVAAPYLRSGIVQGLGERTTGGRAVRVAAAPGAGVVTVVPERLAVAYDRAGRARLRRRVDVRLRLAADAPDGTRTLDRACVRTFADDVAVRDRARLEDAALPETVGVGPAPSRLARTLQAGLAGAAVLVSTLLLFSLRSS